jgi:cyclopropane-fatty-acyl-phospholipid synthase
MLLASLLEHLITVGTLRVIDGSGRTHSFGVGDGPLVTVRLRDRKAERELFWNPRLKAGELYMDGRLTIEDGTIYDFLDLAAWNMQVAPPSPLAPLYLGFGRSLRWLQQWNPVGRAREHVAHHYDLSDALYELFLDRDRQYSCAYFAHPGDDLETAQLEKKRHLAAKLGIAPGQRVLDIGSGWGGLALFLAAECGARATGLTLSSEQLKVAQRRAASAGLGERVEFHLRDYREETGKYDRIVSVGMFEHVGVPHYRAYFDKIRDLLADDGIAVLHSIGRSDGPGHTNPWMRKYIFPGGYSPALSEVIPHIERAGLWITDIEILRLHYAETLRAWRQRFAANRDKVKALYDERFCRMWEFYLAGSEVAFRRQGHMNFQIQMAKRVDSVPLTRDYIYEWERGTGTEFDRMTGRAA